MATQSQYRRRRDGLYRDCMSQMGLCCTDNISSEDRRGFRKQNPSPVPFRIS
jgi:hypothetical protein